MRAAVVRFRFSQSDIIKLMLRGIKIINLPMWNLNTVYYFQEE